MPAFPWLISSADNNGFMELACISVSANWVNYTLDGHLLKGGWWGWVSFTQQGLGTCIFLYFPGSATSFRNNSDFFNNFDFLTVSPQALVPPAVLLWCQLCPQP